MLSRSLARSLGYMATAAGGSLRAIRRAVTAAVTAHHQHHHWYHNEQRIPRTNERENTTIILSSFLLVVITFNSIIKNTFAVGSFFTAAKRVSLASQGSERCGEKSLRA